ncbi:DUF417 family protein [Mesorhizobium sp. B2-7-1]|uniref:DUF417 family protein n=1 Tax=Mesorhizobium sp. B2-7-1 TaxID=2589909 RepID=UPI0032B23B19
MHREFNIAETGFGSYWPLAILRWVMVLIFVSFGIQKFTPQSAQGIALYISNSPFVSWLQIFGIRGEAYLLGCIELGTAALLALGGVCACLVRPWRLDRGRYVSHHLVIFLYDPSPPIPLRGIWPGSFSTKT